MLTGSLKAAQMDASSVSGLEEGEIVVDRDAERKRKEWGFGLTQMDFFLSWGGGGRELEAQIEGLEIVMESYAERDEKKERRGESLATLR